jgi:MFS family permease
MPSTGSRQTTGRARWTIALAILLVAIIGVAMSMTLPLLSLRLDQAGWSGGMIGLNTSFMALATLSLAPFIPGFAKKFGIRALLVTALVTGATATLGFGWAHSVWIWFALRFMLGCSLTVLFILSEFWINAASPDDRRGLIMGIYGTILSLGFASGSLVLQQTGTEGEWPLILGAGIFVLALVPVWMAGRQTPQMDGHAGLGFASLFRSAPVAALAALLFGAVETGAFSVLPVYGHRIGLDDRAAAMQISAVALGNLFFQIPFGLLADRVDKRRLLLLIAGLAGLVTLVIPFLSPLSWLYLGTLCLWGGVAASLYCVGLALLGAQFHGASLVAANALFVMLYATGQMIGPPLLGWAMDMVNPHGYIWASASLFGLYIAIVLGFGRPKSG